MPCVRRLRTAAWIGRQCAREPLNIRRYFRNRRQWPLEVGLPWFAYGAVDFLEPIVGPGTVVYEFGTGGSTKFFAERGASVVAIEDDAVWAEKTRAAVDGDVDIIVAPTPRTVADVRAWGELLPRHRADVVVIDAFDLPFVRLYRPELVEVAESRVKPGGHVVLDDADWLDSARELSKADHRHSFRGFGPGRIGGTSTDIWCY